METEIITVPKKQLDECYARIEAHIGITKDSRIFKELFCAFSNSSDKVKINLLNFIYSIFAESDIQLNGTIPASIRNAISLLEGRCIISMTNFLQYQNSDETGVITDIKHIIPLTLEKLAYYKIVTDNSPQKTLFVLPENYKIGHVSPLARGNPTNLIRELKTTDIDIERVEQVIKFAIWFQEDSVLFDELNRDPSFLNQHLIKAYTEHPLPQNQIDSILQSHPDFADEHDGCMDSKTHNLTITKRAIIALLKLVKKSVVKGGEFRMYKKFENKISERAYQEFYDEISHFHPHERDALLNALIPRKKTEQSCSLITLLNEGTNSCIVDTGKKMARLVYLYYPEKLDSDVFPVDEYKRFIDITLTPLADDYYARLAPLGKVELKNY